MKDSAHSAKLASKRLKDFRKLLLKYRPIGEIKRPEDPGEAAAMDEALSQYRSIGTQMWELAHAVTEHLPEEDRSRELEWMKEKLQAAGMLPRE